LPQKYIGRRGRIAAGGVMKGVMKRVTLTFDNGPTPGVTERVLEIVAARGILATFFVVGNRLDVPGGRELAERAHREGHWIGNHSLTHAAPLGEHLDPAHARREIEDAQRRIGPLAHPDKLFRPMGGGGRIGPHLLSRAALDCLQAGQYTCVLWSSVPGDWKDPEGWVDRAVADVEAHDWTTVVLHDIENASLARLPDFLDRLNRQGVEWRQDFADDVIVLRRGQIMSPLAVQIVSPSGEAADMPRRPQ
jgi:peptidoglycan/xylan/chitin deacetylase (PgdA/CDA1 family)